MADVPRETGGDLPPAPAVVAATWPEAAAGLTAYAELLATAGVERGLVGPREVPRLWERHVLNCAVVEQAVPASARVADIGSGAGLPGLVLALVRPDLVVTLVEPLERRSLFLTEAVDALGLDGRAEVRRARAEALAAQGAGFDVVTARAVAPLERLAGWCLPLVRPGGRLVAMKGSRAADEVAAAAAVLRDWGAPDAEVRELGAGVVDPPTTVVVAERLTAASPRRAPTRRKR